MKTLNLQQGTPEWHAVRLKHHTASQAPVMMGAAKTQTRDDLLREKKSGVGKEHSSYTENVVFARGHEVEEKVRQIIEEHLDRDFYPVTGLGDNGLLASFDGIDLSETTAIEVKQWNEADATIIKSTGKLEPKHYWQLEQQLSVCETLERVIFIMSDGTRDKWVEVEYVPVRGRRKKLLAGWEQFDADLAAMSDPEPTVEKAVAQELANLPALRIQVSESHVLASNLDAYKAMAQDYIESINTELVTDQDFVNAEADVKFCQNAEKDLMAVKVSVANSSASIEEVLTMIDGVHEQLRQKRLSLDKLVKAEKQNRKAEILRAANNAFDAYCEDLGEGLHGYRINTRGDFVGAMYGLKTLESCQSKVNDALAAAKIEAKEEADHVLENWAMIPEGSRALFADWAHVARKDREDFVRLVNDRIKEDAERVEQMLADKHDAVAGNTFENSGGFVDQTTPDAPAFEEFPKEQQIPPRVNNFDDWWENVGSGMVPAPGEDHESHCKRVARMAWGAAG